MKTGDLGLVSIAENWNMLLDDGDLLRREGFWRKVSFKKQIGKK